MSEIKQVFISSTVFDLPDHRKRAVKACGRAGMHAIDMANWTAQAANAVEVSLGKVDQADLYIGIFAHRYGYRPPGQPVPPGEDISITEMEYRRAVDRGIPRLIFLMHEDHWIKACDVECGPGKDKLDKLKKELQLDHVCGEFETLGDLELLVFQSLVEYRGAGPVSMPDEREDVASPAPTAEPREAPAVGPGETVCVYCLVAYSADGRRWQPVPADGRVPRGARLRVVYRPETPCHLLLLIETINHQQERFQLHHLGPVADEDSPEATAVAASAEWQTIPRGMFLKEQVPDEVSAWRIGLLLGTKPPTGLFSALVSRDRPSDSSEGVEEADSQAAFQDWIASVDSALPPADRIKCRPVTEKIFGLGIDGSVQAFRVSGRESIIHWSEVRFE